MQRVKQYYWFQLRFIVSAILLASFPLRALAAEDETPTLLNQTQLEARGISSVAYYYCPRGTQCSLRCAAGPDQVAINYTSVRRLEMGEGDTERLLGIYYADPVGKAHVATAFFPAPSSCALEDLVMEAIAPVEDGTVFKPTTNGDVIFEVQRDR